MDSFFALPLSTPLTPISSSPADVILDDFIRPIVPIRTSVTYPSIFNVKPLIIPKVVTSIGVSSLFGPTTPFYYDSGIGENYLAQHETNVDLRYKFLDKWLYDDFPEILRMLKVDSSGVKVLSKSEAEKNDISKDSEDDLYKKSDFIGHEILTLHKNRKILDTICAKNNLKYYDLPHNLYFVRKAQGKYVMKKLEEMKK
jgi:hypothetical protein